MTRDEIIKLTQEAGLYLATDVHWMPIIGLEYAEKFAALVAAAEREACAKVCDEEGLHITASIIRARGKE